MKTNARQITEKIEARAKIKAGECGIHDICATQSFKLGWILEELQAAIEALERCDDPAAKGYLKKLAKRLDQ